MNFFFILMKNGTGINKTGQFVLVSLQTDSDGVCSGKMCLKATNSLPLRVTKGKCSLSSALLIQFPRISDTKKSSKENSFSLVVFSVHFLIKRILFRACVAVMCAQHSLSVFSFFGGKWKYDNLVRLACFIRRYFSNASSPFLIASSYVAPIFHTCTLECPVSSVRGKRELKSLINSHSSRVTFSCRQRTKAARCIFYEMRINEILKFWWREFSSLRKRGRERARRPGMWSNEHRREAIRN